jgi:hypothetical protein
MPVVPSLQDLAYRSIPRNKYHNVLNSNTTHSLVLKQVKSEVTSDHRTVKDWAKSVKIPLYIQNLLTMFNLYSKADFFNAYNNIIEHNKNTNLVLDYWFHIVGNLEYKILWDNKLTDEQQEESYVLHKWPKILEQTFHCLCYKRLKYNKNYVFDAHPDICMDDELFAAIMSLPDSKILHLIIYNMIDRHSKTKKTDPKQICIIKHTNSIKIPESVKTLSYIQNLLTLINHLTKADFFNAYNKTIIKIRGPIHTLKDIKDDYWFNVVENLQDKILLDHKLSKEEQQELYVSNRWPKILEKTFYCLCYKRLEGLSNIKPIDIFDEHNPDIYMHSELFDAIMSLPESEILHLIIYNMIEINVRPNTSPNNRPNSSPNSSPNNRPNTSPNNRPNTSPNNRPNTSPNKRPNTSPNNRPNTSPNNRPNTSPNSRPNTSPNNRPNTSPNTSPNNRPNTSPNNRPNTSPNNRPNKQRKT